MLDMGFIHDVRRVLKLLPEKKQTLFFSATMPPEVMGLVDGLLHDYARVAVDPVSSPVEAIRQSLYYVDKANKTKLLAWLMQERQIASALVFSRTKHGANRIAQDLNRRGITAAAIHGNKSQTARVQALSDFKAGRVRVLAATDIAARGLDIDGLPFVINYNLPDVPETYVHRIGRTGRAGREGEAISFCQFDEKDELKAIEKLLGRPIPVVEDHPYPMENFDPPVRDKHGKIINAEDAEARAAAKEKRRQTDAENRARAEERKQAAAQAVMPPVPPAPAEEPDAPKKKKRRRKKNGGGQGALTPVQTPAPTPAKEELLVLRDRPAGSGIRLGRLEDTPTSARALAGAPFELKSSGGVNPPSGNPSDSAADSRRPRFAGAKGLRQGRLEDTLPEDPAMPAVDFVKPNPLDSDVIMDATARLLAPRPKIQAQPQQKPETLRPASKPRQGKKGKKPGAPPRATRQKSLMRPYYLHDDD